MDEVQLTALMAAILEAGDRANKWKPDRTMRHYVNEARALLTETAIIDQEKGAATSMKVTSETIRVREEVGAQEG